MKLLTTFVRQRLRNMELRHNISLIINVQSHIIDCSIRMHSPAGAILQFST